MTAETVTVMFTDLVDSTALLSTVGEEAAEGLRREHFALLRAAIEPASGREVKNLGDGLMIVFSSAADAVAAGVAVLRTFSRRNRRAEHPLSIRVGIALGDADMEDGDYFGVPVVQAARLCAEANGEEILATDVVRLLAGSRGGFAFEAIRDLDLKGLDEPVAACRVEWRLVDASDELPPVPARLASSLAASFVGRDEEYERMSAAWKAAASQAERQVMVLSGEPGIGKTTLSARFAQHVHDEGALVAYGRSDEDLGIPYQPWIEALTQLVTGAPEELLAEHVADRGGSLARLVPELARRVPVDRTSTGDGDSERFALFACVADLLERLSQEQPLLLVLDDLHWADRPSVQLLRHVVTDGRPLRLAVLGTLRSSEVTTAGPIAEFLAALYREQGVERFDLRGLSDADLLALLEQFAGHEMTEQGVALRDAMLAETGGNPFFVREILRHLAETGAIYQNDDGRWVTDTDLRAVGLPVSVKEVVSRRLAGLGPDTERILALGAVIGRDFEVPLLAAVAQVDEETIVDVCDATVAATVLQTTDDPDRYTFAHALIEHTLYDGMSPARRSRAHRAVAEQIEVLSTGAPGDRAGELAHHWAAAVQPTDTAKAIHYAELAAGRATEQLAPDEARRWHAQALELLDRTEDPDPRQRAEILVGLGNAERQCGIARHRETLLEAAGLADEIDAVDLLVRAALANSRGWISVIGELDHERVEVIDRAIERLDDRDSPERARLLALAAIERYYVADLDELLALAEDMVATARRSGDLDTLAFALHKAAVTVRSPVALDRRIAWLTEGRTLAEQSGDLETIFNHRNEEMLVAFEQGDLAQLTAHRVACEELVERAPNASARWTNAFQAVWHATLRGDLEEAERLNDAAFALGSEIGAPDASTIYGAQLVNIRFHQGRLDGLISLIEEAIAESPTLYAYRAVLAMTCGRCDQAARAIKLLDEAVSTGFAIPVDNAWTTAAASWADAAVRVGHHRSAEILHGLLLPFHDHIVTTSITLLPAVADYLGRLDHLLGRHDDADRWFTEAMGMHERLEGPLLITYTQTAWAAMLVDRSTSDDLAPPREMAERALAAAQGGGYGYVEADATAVLERLKA